MLLLLILKSDKMTLIKVIPLFKVALILEVIPLFRVALILHILQIYLRQGLHQLITIRYQMSPSSPSTLAYYLRLA